jgi:hypothetical protein
MAVRMHKILAALNKQDSIFDVYKGVFTTVFNKAKQFDFGDEERAVSDGVRDTLYQYAKELAKNGLFKLPYDSCYFATSIYDDNGRIDDIFLCLQGEDKNIIEVMNVGYIPQHDMILYVHNVSINLEKLESQIRRSYIIRREKQLNLLYFEKTSHDDMEDARCWVTEIVMCFVALLSSPSVEIRPISSSSSVNKRRAKKGLLPINEVNEVHIRLNGVRYTTSGEAMGSHASPRAHWRRGHVRRLPSGQITNVRPCLVAYTGNENIPEQTYKVTA